jgi:hypothetical protein
VVMTRRGRRKRSRVGYTAALAVAVLDALTIQGNGALARPMPAHPSQAAYVSPPVAARAPYTPLVQLDGRAHP